MHGNGVWSGEGKQLSDKAEVLSSGKLVYGAVQWCAGSRIIYRLPNGICGRKIGARPGAGYTSRADP